jgi:transcriptional regulator with XRE-family HTH domain
MEFAANLKRLRKAAKLSQEGLALACGWSGQSRVGNYESGFREPELAEIPVIARALGVQVGELFGEAPSHSHLVRLDPERIAELATVLAERWKDVPGGFDLRDEEHAAHFVLCYGLYINMKERPVPENTVAFSAALTSPQGANKDERGENVPTTGTAGRKVGKGGKR